MYKSPFKVSLCVTQWLQTEANRLLWLGLMMLIRAAYRGLAPCFFVCVCVRSCLLMRWGLSDLKGAFGTGKVTWPSAGPAITHIMILSKVTVLMPNDVSLPERDKHPKIFLCCVVYVSLVTRQWFFSTIMYYKIYKVNPSKMCASSTVSCCLILF